MADKAREKKARRRARMKRRCIRKGGEVHELQNNDAFDCVFTPQGVDTNSGSNSDEINKEIAQMKRAIQSLTIRVKILEGKKNPENYGRRRCLRNGGTFTISYSENGKETGRFCDFANSNTEL